MSRWSVAYEAKCAEIFETFATFFCYRGDTCLLGNLFAFTRTRVMSRKNAIFFKFRRLERTAALPGNISALFFLCSENSCKVRN